MPTVLNVGLDPKSVGDPNAPSSAFPTVGTAQVQAGLDAAAAGGPIHSLSSSSLGLLLIEDLVLDHREEHVQPTPSPTLVQFVGVGLIGGFIVREALRTP